MTFIRLQKRVKKADEASARAYHSSNVPLPVYNVGDKVCLLECAHDTKTKRPAEKLKRRYQGKLEIIEEISDHSQSLKLLKATGYITFSMLNS